MPPGAPKATGSLPSVLIRLRARLLGSNANTRLGSVFSVTGEHVCVRLVVHTQLERGRELIADGIRAGCTTQVHSSESVVLYGDLSCAIGLALPLANCLAEEDCISLPNEIICTCTLCPLHCKSPAPDFLSPPTNIATILKARHAERGEVSP